MDKTLKAWLASCGGQAIISTVASIVVLCGVAAIAVASFVIPLPPEYEDERFFLFIGLFVVFFLFVMAAVVGIGVLVISRRARQFDAAFTPLGLTGSGYLTNGRQYHGTYLGRQVDVYFYRGPTLDIYIASPLRTRMGIATKNALGSMASSVANRPPLDTGDPAYTFLSIYPHDERWARELLADPNARESILRLTQAPGPFELTNLLVQPEALQLKLYRTQTGRVTPDAVRDWLKDMLTVVRAAEGLPAPAELLQSSNLERVVRTERGAFSRKVVFVTLAAFGLMFVCMLAALIPFLILVMRGE